VSSKVKQLSRTCEHRDPRGAQNCAAAALYREFLEFDDAVVQELTPGKAERTVQRRALGNK
jgi:hypothetical protein